MPKKVKTPPTILIPASSSHQKRSMRDQFNRFSYLNEDSENINCENIDLKHSLLRLEPKEEKNSKSFEMSKPNKCIDSYDSAPTAAFENLGDLFKRMSEYFKTIYNPDQILFRENEKEKILKFLNDCFEMKPMQRNLLVTGKPGCGKTLTVNHIFENLMNIHEDVLFVKVNAMAFKTQEDFFEAIALQIQTKKALKSRKKEALVEILKTQKVYRQIVVMIDEIDSLLGKYNGNNNEVLDIFLLSNDLENKLCTIGISNTMELLLKIGSKIKSGFEGIQNVVFASYSVPEMMQIVEDRIEDFMKKNDFFGKIKESQILEENALRLCSARLFNLKGGDIRALLEVLMKTLIRHHDKQSQSGNQAIKAISLADLLDVMDEIYSQKKMIEIIDSLPITQQTMLLVLYTSFASSQEKKEVPLIHLLSSFNVMGSDFGIPKHQVMNFLQGLKLLESYDIIEIKHPSKFKNSSPGENYIVKLRINPAEIKTGLNANEAFGRYFEA